MTLWSRQLLADAVRQFGAYGTFVGMLCGTAYGIGGFFVDLATTGLNAGTALAMMALVGMPLMGFVMGGVAGALWAPLWNRLPSNWGGRGANS